MERVSARAGTARPGVALALPGARIVRRATAPARAHARVARRAAILALALGLLAPGTAGAHGGILLASTTAGPYRVQVTGAPLTEPGRPAAIDVTVYVSAAASGTPVSDATVATTVTADGETTTPTVRQVAGGYEAIVPVEDAFTVGEQAIEVDVAGPLGTGHVTVRPAAGDGGPPVVPVAISAVVLLVLCAVAVRVRRRRARADAPDGDARAAGADA
jgi:hypothetical protein